jgi:hypothetical protein
MTKLNIWRSTGFTLLGSIFALLLVPATTPAIAQVGSSYATAKVIELDRQEEGTLPIGQGRKCFQAKTPAGQRLLIRGRNDHGTVFFSAYTNRGQILIGETQVLAAMQPEGVIETEENDGSVMVCIDSDTASRTVAHRYSLQVSLLGSVGAKPM